MPDKIIKVTYSDGVHWKTENFKALTYDFTDGFFVLKFRDGSKLYINKSKISSILFT